jgi:hypothetical protein
MANVMMKTRKLLKKVAGKVEESPLGRKVGKIPAPIRKGFLTGLLVPVPGVAEAEAEAGALAGAGVWAKDAIERAVRRRTGEPDRMFGEEPAAGCGRLPAGSGRSPFTSPARKLLGDMFPHKSKHGDSNVASPVIELAEAQTLTARLSSPNAQGFRAIRVSARRRRRKSPATAARSSASPSAACTHAV